MKVKSQYAAQKEKYLSYLRSAEAQVERIKLKIALLEEMKYESAPDEPKPTAANQHAFFPEPETGKDYSGFTVTAAVLDALGTMAKEKGVTAPQLRDFMVKHKLSTKSKNILTTINTALARQADAGKIRTEMFGGKRLYFSI